MSASATAHLRDEGPRRPDPRRQRLRLLAGIIGLSSGAEAIAICAEFYPSEPVPERSAAVLRELFS